MSCCSQQLKFSVVKWKKWQWNSKFNLWSSIDEFFYLKNTSVVLNGIFRLWRISRRRHSTNRRSSRQNRSSKRSRIKRVHSKKGLLHRRTLDAKSKGWVKTFQCFRISVLYQMSVDEIRLIVDSNENHVECQNNKTGRIVVDLWLLFRKCRTFYFETNSVRMDEGWGG